MKVGVYEAKSKLSKMMKLAHEGEEIIITQNGKDSVKLVPIQEKRDWIGMYKGQIVIHDNFYDPLGDDETVQYLTGEIESKLFPDENTD